MKSIVPFEEIFNNTIYRIPDYQRGYSWTKEQLDDLWADLNNTHTNRNAFHFTGILTVDKFSDVDFERIEREGFSVVEENGDRKILIDDKLYNTYNLVDGQQRLTTILILLSLLIKNLRNPEEREVYVGKYFHQIENGNKYLFGYHIDVPSHNYLIREIFGDNSFEEEATETLYTHNLDFAKDFFIKNIDGFSQNELKDLIEKITRRLLFSVLNLSNSGDAELDISMIFETLNFRGKQLSGLERFKNRVLYLLSKQQFQSRLIASRRELVNKTWLEVYKWLGRNKKRPMDDDAFLKAFWLLYFSNKEMVSKEFKAYQKNLFEKDFSLINISENPFMKPDILSNWLRTMRRAIKVWYFINNPYDVDGDNEFDYHYTPEIQRSLHRIGSFPRSYGKYMLNLLLAVLLRDLPRKREGGEVSEDARNALRKVEDILWTIERHNVMCFVLNGNTTAFNQENTFRDINKYYRTGSTKGGGNLEDVLYSSRVNHFNWENVKRNVLQNDRFYSWDSIHFVLREYEELISGEMVTHDIVINLIYPDADNAVQRNSYRDINSILKDNRQKYSYSLGNIFISNNSHHPRSFEDHKLRIQIAKSKNYKIYKSEDELLEYNSWTMESIVNRGTKIIDSIVANWEIPEPSESVLKSLFGHT